MDEISFLLVIMAVMFTLMSVYSPLDKTNYKTNRKDVIGMNEHEYIDVNTAAEIIGVCPDTIRKLANQDGFPCVKIGRRYIINKMKFFNWMDNHEGKEIIID